MSFIDNYNLKWAAADFLFVFDIFANGVWGSEYYEFFAVFGLQPRAVDAAISALQLVRIGVLLYQRRVERETQSPKSSALHDEKKLGDD